MTGVQTCALPISLNRLAGYADVSAALADLESTDPTFYETHMAWTENGPVAMWEGDGGYESNDPTRPGPRHRLTMVEDHYFFEDDRACGNNPT